ncbi:MAG: MBL fold metallo-hydrolase [Anaerolineae bacterium]|nr:MBL fold metallo-hydrolase [Anaerolineae bacterium]
MDIQLLKHLHWLGHDSFHLDGPPIIYFDPWKLPDGLPKADIVLISHEHGDHCSPDDIRKISGPGTSIVANETAAAKLKGNVHIMVPDDVLELSGIKIEAVPAYNINKFRAPGVPFHPKEARHNGYIVTVDDERVYFAGDTDHIPEMAQIDCDVALLPVSGTYVMTAEEAAQAAQTISPQVAIPMHYGAGVVGTLSDAERFKSLYRGQVIIPSK